MEIRNKHIRGFSGLIFLMLIALQSQAQQTGSITGQVTDQENGQVLQGANLRLQGTSAGAVSDAGGRYVIANVPAGVYQLVVSYIGYQAISLNVSVEGGSTTSRDVELENNFIELEGITVTGNRQGQAQALSRQKNADNIKNVVAADLIGRFPDPNVADALQRVPAVSVQRDQGESRYVQIRGTNPNLSNISINGEQIPSPEGDVRYAALDMIPTGVLSSIEVNKALTPDMDGDAIGGSVNLNTLSAVGKGRILKGTASLGYNDQAQDYSPLGAVGSLTYGNRTDDGAFGYLLSGSYNVTNRASDNNEVEYDEGELETLELRDYELRRKRIGAIGSFDYRFNSGSKLFLNTSYNFFSDQELRRALILENVESVREFKDRFEEQQIFSLSAGGDHLLNDRFQLDYMASYSYADQNTPKDRQVSFAQAYEDADEEDIEFIDFDRSNPDYPQFSVNANAPSGAGIYNYDAYEFDELEDSGEQTSDRHFTTRLNLKMNYGLGDAAGSLKFGGLFRTKQKELNPDIGLFGYEGDFLFSDIQGDFEDDDFLSNEYEQGVGLFPDEDALGNFFDANRSSFEREEDDSMADTESERYDATENTYAFYGMSRLQKGSLSGLIGVRYERTNVDYNANSVEFDENGDLLPVESTSGENDFGFFLPMVHLKYELSSQTNLRFAWTNSFAKPNYFDLAPYRIITREDEELEIGNPGLDATTSMNLDLMAEYYFNNVGLISAGVFYKKLDNFIYFRNFEFQGGGGLAGFETTQPVNGEDADLAGVEFNLQQQLTFLPGALDGLGLYANYTYSWSEANLITADGSDRAVSLPGQAENTGNLALSYEKYGFSGRISLAYAGAFIDELRESSANDRIYDEHLQLDFSASQQITPRSQFFLELVNLTNETLRYYNGVTSRLEQQEFYSFWGNAGIKFDF
jgi:TonB-dependent receptor